MRAGLLRLLTVIAGACLMAAPALAHRVHAGVTEIAINERTQELEIIHRVYGHDLLTAMGLDVPDEEVWFAESDNIAAIGVYAAAWFRLGEGDGRLIEPVYVGAELDGELAWIYFSAPIPPATDAFVVDNDLLSDAFEDQVMMTNITMNSLVRTAMQGPGRRDPVRVRFEAE
tara:strand:- start:24985 stop:25500 length:516 start_codon:yes stop_codon:yes gene_type:complete